jgi:protein tyrosine phosphatase
MSATTSKKANILYTMMQKIKPLQVSTKQNKEALIIIMKKNKSKSVITSSGATFELIEKKPTKKGLNNKILQMALKSYLDEENIEAFDIGEFMKLLNVMRAPPTDTKPTLSLKLVD